ncbi:hypothetical protein [Bacillus bombysepticus]|uniref:hypothetical protein n=1 Tax=Bacillus bombysepticus TaxID=658666 RepID=UPI003015FFF7
MRLRVVNSQEIIKTNEYNGYVFHPNTEPKVKEILSEYANTDISIRLFYGDQTNGTDWLVQKGTIGYIQAKTGSDPSLFLSEDKQQRNGFMISTEKIVRITVDCKEVYRHKDYNIPLMRIEPAKEGAKALGYRSSVFAQVSMGTWRNIGDELNDAMAFKLIQFLQGSINN